MRIGVISAMDSEHRQLAERLTQAETNAIRHLHFVTGLLAGNELVLTQCGIGKVNAALGAQTLISQFAPDCVISTGVAGGIDSSLKVTDVVASSALVYHDMWCGEGNEWGQVQGLPTRYKGDERLLQVALQLGGTGALESTIHGGLICTGDQFIQDAGQLAQIKAHFPDGLAVDMESAAIAQTCYLMDVPFLSFRIISDTPGAEADNFAQYKDFWHTVAERGFNTTWAFLQALPDAF